MFDWIFNSLALFVSLIALVLSVISFFQSRTAVVKDYFFQGDSVEMKAHRKTIYDIYNNESDEDIIFNELLKHEDDVAHVISFFDFWALMVKKHYLPRWTFHASPRYVTTTIYDKVLPYITHRRIHQPEYACYYEWLVGKLQRAEIKAARNKRIAQDE